MIRTARHLASAALGLLLVSGLFHNLAVSLGYGRRAGALLGVLWAMPVAVVVVLLALSRSGRTTLRRLTESHAHLAVSALAVAVLLLTLVPFRCSDRWMVTYLALSSTAFILLLVVGYPTLAQLFGPLRRIALLLLYQLRPATFLLFTSCVMLAITNLISWIVFQHMPHIQDAVDQVFQARIFASGRISIPARFDDYFFSYLQVINDGTKMYAQYPFGHSLLLALGSLLRAEWLVNPLLGSAEVIVLYLLGKEAYDERTGRIAALLGVASPFLLFMSSEFMNHASALLFLSLFLLLFFRTIRPLRGRQARTTFLDPVASGLCLGVALNIRPLSALAVSLPIACCALYLSFRSRGRLLPQIVALLMPVLLGLGAFGLYNYLTTGDPLLTGYEAYGMMEYGHSRLGYGFGMRGFDVMTMHTLWRGLLQAGGSLNALNVYLFEGPFPGLLLVLLLFLTTSRRKMDGLLLACFAALPASYLFYWWQDLISGPRFLYEGLAPILLLSARGLVEFPGFVGRAVGADSETRAKRLIFVGLVVAAVVAATVGLPRLLFKYGYSYGEYRRVRARITEKGIRNAVVFLGPPRAFYYGAAFLDNTLDFQGPIVYAVDRGAEDYLLMRRFPGRTYYRANPDTFYQTTPESLRNAPQIRDLERAGEYVRRNGTAAYRYVLLPYREAGVLVDTGTARCRTFREVSYDVLRERRRLEDFLPAVAVFMPRDPRRYSSLFEPMRESRDYVAGGCRFTLLFRADSGNVAVYDIRSATDRRPDGDTSSGQPKQKRRWCEPSAPR